MSVQNKKTAFALVGPTCTGKSRLAIDLASQYPVEIISADSRLIYKGMDIGTSKPTFHERKQVPHYLIDRVFPNEEYNVALYKKEAEAVMGEIFSRNKLPVFVGGTGLYLSAVLSGLAMPNVKPDVKLREELSQVSQFELYERLKKLDPVATTKIHANDNFRTVRALEVIHSTGKPVSEQQKKGELSFNVIWVGLAFRDKEKYYEQINKRTKLFMDNGLVDEVQLLLEKYGELELFKNTIGYAETVDFIRGDLSQEEAANKILFSTRQYAKRQMTWFRANKDIKWVYVDDLNGDDLSDQVHKICLMRYENAF